MRSNEGNFYFIVSFFNTTAAAASAFLSLVFIFITQIKQCKNYLATITFY